MLDTLERLAKGWATYVSRDSTSIIWSPVLAINGLVFIAIHFLVIESMILVLIGALAISAAVLAFERHGFFRLLEENSGKDAKHRSPTA